MGCDRGSEGRGQARAGRAWVGLLATAALLIWPLGVAAQGDGEEFDFDAALALVDAALLKNAPGVLEVARDSCMKRREIAIRLYNVGQYARAERSLRYCFDVLHIRKKRRVVEKPKGPDPAEIRAKAARELEKALALTPNVAHGLEIYRSCAGCHLPEGWGLSNGSVPQIAGQHHNVVIKQLADIRAGNRDAFLMLPYASVESIGGTQAVADVAGYIDTLEISVENGKGPGTDLASGEKLYKENCVRCHGESGAGDDAKFIPRIQAQHYRYLVHQLEWIRDEKRHNANPEMTAQIHEFSDAQIQAVADYVSRLEPPAELQAPPGWHNPDFPESEFAGPR
jgi:cytochrome c553